MTNEKKTPQTCSHSQERANERLTVKNTREFRRRVELAYTRGKRVEDLKRSLDRKYLASKTTEIREAVAFNGVCYIFDRETALCVTVFPLPHAFGRKFCKCRRRLPVRGGDYELYA